MKCMVTWLMLCALPFVANPVLARAEEGTIKALAAWQGRNGFTRRKITWRPSPAIWGASCTPRTNRSPRIPPAWHTGACWRST